MFWCQEQWPQQKNSSPKLLSKKKKWLKINNFKIKIIILGRKLITNNFFKYYNSAFYSYFFQKSCPVGLTRKLHCLKVGISQVDYWYHSIAKMNAWVLQLWRFFQMKLIQVMLFSILEKVWGWSICSFTGWSTQTLLW